MFQLSRPTVAQIAAFLAAQRGSELSYEEVGATRYGSPPAGYTVDRNRVRLCVGGEVYRQAVVALRSWRMSTLGWSTIHQESTAVVAGATIAVVLQHYGFWSLNAARIVYVFDEDTAGVQRTGFAYGTLADHAEVGEERFVVEWQRADDSVWYDLYAFSRPGHVLARLGYPIGRGLQKRFARESKQAMVAATRESGARENLISLAPPSS